MSRLDDIMSFVRHDYKPGEIIELCKSAIAAADTRIAKLQPGDFSVLEEYETIAADLGERTSPALFMKYAHTDERIRKDAEESTNILNKYLIDLTTRRGLYDTLKNAGAHARTPLQKRLANKILREFRRSGLEHDDKTVDFVKEKSERLATIQNAFESNLSENKDYALMSEDDIQGIPAGIIETFEKADDGYKVSVKPATYAPFMIYAKNPDARKRLMQVHDNVAAQTNIPLLNEAVQLRRQIAHALGYKHWGDYSTEIKMSRDAKTVLDFLNTLRHDLAPGHKADMAKMQEYKHKEHPAEPLHPWDIAYYDNKVQETEFNINSEEIQEYFPADFVVGKMFDIYSTVLGLQFKEVEDADVWAKDVKLYEIHNADGSFVGHFFTDFFPRDGKYQHFAAWDLRNGRMATGKWITPIAAILGNFTPPTTTQPSLLRHEEVETLFHEFGHVMHMAVTTSPYGSLASTKCPWDFVEAPSQMLENWVWNKEMLKKISLHYKSGRPLPDDVIDRLVESRRFNQAYQWTRQVFFSLYDIHIHTAEHDLDVNETFKRMYEDTLGMRPLAGTHWIASFGHLMNGYDAGYYGYTWSKRYAQDMFTRFENEGVLSKKVGADYRRLLAAGDMEDPQEAVLKFLGREPSNDAFLKLMGLP